MDTMQGPAPHEVVDQRVLRVVRRFIEETREILQAADSIVWVLDDGESALTPLASARTPDHLFMAMRTPVEDSVVGVVARTGMPAVIGPADRHNPIAERVSGIMTEWMVAAPVHVQGRIGGVLSAIQSDPARAFGGSDLELITWRAELLGYVVQAALEPVRPL